MEDKELHREFMKELCALLGKYGTKIIIQQEGWEEYEMQVCRDSGQGGTVSAGFGIDKNSMRYFEKCYEPEKPEEPKGDLVKKGEILTVGTIGDDGVPVGWVFVGETMGEFKNVGSENMIYAGYTLHELKEVMAKDTEVKKAQAERRLNIDPAKLTEFGTECRIGHPESMERLENNLPDKEGEIFCTCVGGCLLSPSFLTNEWRALK